MVQWADRRGQLAKTGSCFKTTHAICMAAAEAPTRTHLVPCAAMHMEAVVEAQQRRVLPVHKCRNPLGGTARTTNGGHGSACGRLSKPQPRISAAGCWRVMRCWVRPCRHGFCIGVELEYL